MGSGLCPLAVRFRAGGRGAAELAAQCKALKDEIRRGGSLYEGYPKSLFRRVSSWKGLESPKYFVEGARSSIVIAQKLIKSFCGASAECVLAYKIGEKSKWCTREAEKSLEKFGIEAHFEYLNDGMGDNQLDVVFDEPCGSATARMYQAPRSSFKYSLNLEKIEKELGKRVDILLLNRAAKGAKSAAMEILSRRGENPLVSYRLHNFSRHAGAAENIDMLEAANFIFMTDPKKDPTIARELKRHFDADDLDVLARAILEINDERRIVVVPPDESEFEKGENLRFYSSDFNKFVEVKCPDYPRARTAWLNGACVALACKKWGANPPFELDGRFPKTYADFEAFANWAVQMAYAESPSGNFEPEGSWIIE